MERPPRSRRQRLSVFPLDARHVVQLVGISNEKLDALLDRSREVSAQAERKKIFADVTKILQDELPMVFIVHPIEPKAFSQRVQGYDPIPDGMMRFKDVWLK